MIKIATRKSLLATYQATAVKNLLAEHGISSEFMYLETSGDRKAHPLFAGKGIFIKELQERLKEGQADIAVHSLKDLPTLPVKTLALYAFLPRASREDVLIISPQVLQESGLNQLSETKKNNLTFDELKEYLLKSEFFCTMPFGTSSLRRTALIKEYFGQSIPCQTLRGNVDSRLKRARNNEYSCIILAKAGLERLNLYTNNDMFTLDPKVFVPSAGQGVVAIEGRDNLDKNNALINTCKGFTSHQSCLEAGLERTVLFLLECDCYTPVGVYFDGKVLHVVKEKDSKLLKCQITLSEKDLEQLHNLFQKNQNYYHDFFEALCRSELSKKLKVILEEKSFII